jgi:D-lactate dehydrogenase
MYKVGFIDCNASERHFFTRTLKGYKLHFYNSEKDDFKHLDKDIEVLSVFVDYQVTKDIIDHLPKLKLIACRSTGFNNIDLEYARKKGVKVANTPGYGKHSVAEYVFALLLNLSRKITVTLEEEQETDAVARRIERGFDLFGKTLGIVGLGAIGKGVTAIAKGFGMDIIGYDPFPDEDFVQRNSIKLVANLDELLKKSDIVTLHVPLMRENVYLIDEEKMRLMKNSAILINTARGELVDTVALVRILHEKQLAGAALDVVESEYLLDPEEFVKFVSSDTDENRDIALRHAAAILALERMPNVLVTNHNAFNTTEAVLSINEMTTENIKGALTGGKVYEV